MVRNSSSVLVHAWRWAAGALAFGAAAFGLVGFVASTPAAADSTASKVVQCDSGIVTAGDLSTSSVAVARVPIDTIVPEACGVVG